MSDNESDVSVIICAYTEVRWLETLKAIESIEQQTLPARETILVIDHNSSLFERFKTHFSGIPGNTLTVIENNHARGLSGARNSGIAQTQGGLVAFLDDDAMAEPDWLERLSNGCQDPNVLGTGGVVVPLWVGKKPAWFPYEFYWVVGCTYQDQFSIITEVRNPYGGCTCLRREIFEAVGGFNEGIGRIGNNPLGGEETELCIRAKQHSPTKIFLCDPQARIHHHISPARGSLSYFMARCYAEGISKAAITGEVGSKDSLASERSYTLHVLPKGVARGIKDALFKRDLSGFQRSAAIVIGLVTTTSGYLVGKMKRTRIVREEMLTRNEHVPQELAQIKN